MADIITRLVLKSDAWEKNLGNAKKSVGSFEKSVTDMASKAGAGLLKFAGAFGVVVSATEGFNRVIGSSQTLSDEYNRTMDGLKGVVDQFFYSIGSGDWTPFMNGLQDTILLAREAYTAMDQLGNTRMSYNYFNARNMANAQEQIAILKDKDSTKEQKEAAKAKLDEIFKDQAEIVEQYKRRSDEAIQRMVKAAIGFDGVDVSQIDVDRVLRLDVSSMGDKDKAELDKQYKNFEKEYAKIKSKYTTRETVGFGFNTHQVENTDYKAIAKEMQPLIATYQDAIQYNAILVKKNDEWLQQLIDISNGADNADRNLASMKKSMDRASQSGRDSGAKTKKEPSPEGSLGWYAEQISKKQAELKVAVDPQSRLKVQQEIDDLTKQKHYIELELKYSRPEADLKTKKDFADVKKTFAEMSRLPEMPKTIKPFDKKDVKTNKDYANSLHAVADGFGSLSSMAASMENDGLAFITNSFGVIAQMIVQLNALATAEGVASAAKLPFPANLAAIATVVSTVTGIFGSLPKFADGGIIGGSAFFGDNLLARVNSGEMILNQKQQNNLFKIIDGGTSVGGNLTVDGKATVTGKTMYIAIRNYMKSTNKKW